jgi:hypothetical protein
MLWIIATVWLVVVGGAVLDRSVHLKLRLGTVTRSVAAAAAMLEGWPR